MGHGSNLVFRSQFFNPLRLNLASFTRKRVTLDDAVQVVVGRLNLVNHVLTEAESPVADIVIQSIHQDQDRHQPVASAGPPRDGELEQTREPVHVRIRDGGVVHPGRTRHRRTHKARHRGRGLQYRSLCRMGRRLDENEVHDEQRQRLEQRRCLFRVWSIF